MVDKRPALVARPTTAAEVVEAVGYAREHDLPLSVRGGGHHLAGTALADGGLTIDLSLLRDVRVDRAARTAVVGGGCRLGDVDRATQEHGLATPLGFISKVGVGGLTLGGGLGLPHPAVRLDRRQPPRGGDRHGRGGRADGEPGRERRPLLGRPGRRRWRENSVTSWPIFTAMQR